MLQVLTERGRFLELEPVGVIDIGSNSVRLVVYEGAVRSPTPLFNEKVLCGLGRSVASTGRLGAEAVQRALDALARFKLIARMLEVKKLRAIATAAVRDAEDGADFIRRGEKACGVAIEILSGEQEAELAAQGIMMGFVDVDGIAGDLGGGSLELIDLADTRLNHATTLPLGGLRLIDTTHNKLDAALPLAGREIGRVPWLAVGKGRTFYAVGGTWRALAKLHMEQTDYPLRVMHGYRLATRDAIAFCERIRRARKLNLVDGISEVSKPRREVLPYGALVLEQLLKRLEPSEVVFSVFGIREGLLFSELPASERDKDPLVSFSDEYARLRSRSVAHAHELCDWTDQLFVEGGLAETVAERRLRHAACLLSDIGWRAHPDYRGEQSLNVVAHAALGGIDHPGRIFLALAIYYRHAGAQEDPGHLSSRLKNAVDRRAHKRARIVGTAIRVAHMLSVGMAGVIPKTRLAFEDDALALILPKGLAALDGERLRGRLKALAALIERRFEVRVRG